MVEGAEMSTDDLGRFLADGVDPFQSSVWNPVRDIKAILIETRDETLGGLRESVTRVNHVQRLTGPLVVAVFVLSLGVAWLSSRKLSRRVLIPLANLRVAAMVIHDDHRPDGDIELGPAVAEIYDLAATLTTTAAKVRLSQTMLRDQANSDVLTGLSNRSAFNEHLRSKLATACHPPVAVLFIDLDDFKTVNDSLGHSAGDELLQIVAQRLRAAVRSDEMVARLGGDEFAVALDTSDQSPSVPDAAARILATLNGTMTISGDSIAVSASIGIAFSGDDAGPNDVNELLRNADFAMYMA
jgi:diguanylate cyclase (GGDEF)-like protein